MFLWGLRCREEESLFLWGFFVFVELWDGLREEILRDEFGIKVETYVFREEVFVSVGFRWGNVVHCDKIIKREGNNILNLILLFKESIYLLKL